jgi:hypothetical protein
MCRIPSRTMALCEWAARAGHLDCRYTGKICQSSRRTQTTERAAYSDSVRPCAAFQQLPGPEPFSYWHQACTGSVPGSSSGLGGPRVAESREMGSDARSTLDQSALPRTGPGWPWPTRHRRAWIPRFPYGGMQDRKRLIEAGVDALGFSQDVLPPSRYAVCDFLP